MKLPTSFLTASMILFMGGGSLLAQALNVPLDIKAKSDSSVAGYELVESVATFNAASVSPRHSHPGEMVGYILGGTVVLQLDGQAPVTYTSGQTFIVPAGVPHSTTNPTGNEARLLATYFVQKGQALTTSLPR